MATYIKTITDGENDILPRTKAKAVTTESGETVENVLASIKSKTVSATLTAAAWVGTAAPFTQTLSIADIRDDRTNGDIGLSQSATAAQREVARDAMLCITGQSAGTLTIAADGDKPTIDIPVTVTILG